MLFIIILIVVVVFAVGALKAMNPNERAIVIRRTLNICTFGTVYIFRALKALFQTAYYAGSYSGSTMALEGQETLNAMAENNKEVKEKGGATRMAIKSSQEHATNLGLSGMVSDMKAKADAQALALAKRREELLAKYDVQQ